MPEVISDTSPLQYLYQARRLDLLRLLYETVLIPEGVAEEIHEGRSLGYALPDLAEVEWIRITPVPQRRADAALLAASLPALAVPNRLRLAEKGKGASCLALAVESLGAEKLPILGRALMRRVEGVVA